MFLSAKEKEKKYILVCQQHTEKIRH